MSKLLDYLKKLRDAGPFLRGQVLCAGCAGRSHFHEPECPVPAIDRAAADKLTYDYSIFDARCPMPDLIGSCNFNAPELPWRFQQLPAGAAPGRTARIPDASQLGYDSHAANSAPPEPVDPAESGVKRRSDTS